MIMSRTLQICDVTPMTRQFPVSQETIEEQSRYGATYHVMRHDEHPSIAVVFLASPAFEGSNPIPTKRIEVQVYGYSRDAPRWFWLPYSNGSIGFLDRIAPFGSWPDGVFGTPISREQGAVMWISFAENGWKEWKQ